MKRHLVLMVSLCLASPLLAAIVTARNNYFVYPANAASFEGSHDSPGITSSWIPYGTYTDGQGGAEYLRITTNLAGVVYSLFDGLIERSLAASEFHGDLNWDTDTDPNRFAFVVPVSLWGGNDDGGFLLSPTNQTMRLVDVINADSLGMYYNDVYWSHMWVKRSVSTYDGTGLLIEERLAGNLTDSDFPDKYRKGGLAAFFGSRYLDSATSGETLVPTVSTAWSTNLPFIASASNDWVNIWPTYSAVNCDTRIWPYVNYEEMGDTCDNVFVRQHLKDWMTWGSDEWYSSPAKGDSYSAESEALYHALAIIPVNTRIESILSRDTGLEYRQGEYVQWTVGDVVITGDGGPWGGDYGKGIDPTYAEWSAGDLTLRWDKFSGGWQLYMDGEWVDTDNSPWGSTHLSFATGIYRTHDDYLHWKNGSTRLDWKRLGIICQLERQMEQTYHAKEGLAGLRRVDAECKREISFALTNEYSVVAYWSGGHDGGWVMGTSEPLPQVADIFTVSTNVVSTNSNPYCSIGSATVGVSWGGAGERPLIVSISEWEQELSDSECGITVNLVNYPDTHDGGFRVGHPGGSWDFIYGETTGGVRLRTCSFGRTNSKSGTYSHTLPVMSEPTFFPSETPWKKGLVDSVWMPTLECLLSVSNDLSFCGGSLGYDAMLDHRQPTNAMERLFRVDQSTLAKCQSTNDYKRVLQDCLYSLNTKVHEKCFAISGMQSADIENAANWAPSSAEISQVPVTFDCGLEVSPLLMEGYHQVKPTPQFYLADGTVTNSLPVMEDEHGVQGYLVGYVRAYGGDTATATTTNGIPAVVEGKMRQMVKTLWRFNNLTAPKKQQ